MEETITRLWPLDYIVLTNKPYMHVSCIFVQNPICTAIC